jgi:hypothetical protein
MDKFEGWREAHDRICKSVILGSSAALLLILITFLLLGIL